MRCFCNQGCQSKQETGACTQGHGEKPFVPGIIALGYFAMKYNIIFLQILDGIHYLHANWVLHRFAKYLPSHPTTKQFTLKN